jgi:hypothetical protein
MTDLAPNGPCPKKVVLATATAKNAQPTTKPKATGPTAQGSRHYQNIRGRHTETAAKHPRYFYGIVGSVEHINLPKLEDAIQKEFGCRDKRFVAEQVGLMQTEGRVRVQQKSKVWIKQPAY